MAIRISHGDVKTLAQFAIKAGQGEQAVRQAGDAAAMARQQAASDTQLRAQTMRQQADIDMAVIDAQNRREAMEFQSFLGAETARRNMAWEQDKFEQSRQHDLEMVMTRKELESAYQMEKEQRERSKMDAQLQALDDAGPTSTGGTGQLSQATVDNEKLRIQIGVSGRQSELYQTDDEASAFAEMMKRISPEKPIATPVAGKKGKAEYARNNAGKRIVSYDGRQTWQTAD